MINMDGLPFVFMYQVTIVDIQRTILELRRRLQFLLSLLTQLVAQDLARWILRYRIEEYHSACNPLERGDLALHELRDIVGCSGLARVQDNICPRTLVIITILVRND